MPDPDEIRFPCIGCGTMNPAGAEVCSGCKHRFAGPAGGQVVRPLPAMAPEPDVLRIDDPFPLPGSKTTSLLGCISAAFGILTAVVASIVAFVVAFFVTCSSLPGNDSNTLIWSLLAGIGAVAMVVSLAVWIGSKFGHGGNRR